MTSIRGFIEETVLPTSQSGKQRRSSGCPCDAAKEASPEAPKPVPEGSPCPPPRLPAVQGRAAFSLQGGINPQVTSICFQKNIFPPLTVIMKQTKQNVSLMTSLHSQPASFFLFFWKGRLGGPPARGLCDTFKKILKPLNSSPPHLRRLFGRLAGRGLLVFLY